MNARQDTEGIKFFIPEKASIAKTKKIAGPYHRVRDQYLIALALVVSGSAYRWEPHVVIDRLGYLDDHGVAVIAGPLSLIKYTGRESLQELARKHGVTSIYMPPWAFPLLFAFEREEPGEEELILLDMAGLANAKSLLKQLVAMVEIIEV